MRLNGRRESNMMRKLSMLHRSQRGITGLETAIILIAFVVVAAVFAYTALSAGLFSTSKSQEAVYSGLEEAQSTLELEGSVIGYKGDANISSSVGKVEFTVRIATGGEPVDLTPPYALVGGRPIASGLNNPCQIAFNDQAATEDDCVWTLDWVGSYNNDYNVDNDERAVVTVWLHDFDGSSTWSDGSAPFLGSTYVEEDDTFTMEVKPATGAVLVIERTTPAYLDTVIDLH